MTAVMALVALFAALAGLVLDEVSRHSGGAHTRTTRPAGLDLRRPKGHR